MLLNQNQTYLPVQLPNGIALVQYYDMPRIVFPYTMIPDLIHWHLEQIRALEELTKQYKLNHSD